jgi:hypothetical protein
MLCDGSSYHPIEYCIRKTGGGDEVDLKAFFTEMGVEWADRSSIKFVRGLGKLVVVNARENLRVFEKVLSMLNVAPYQIEIEMQFVSFDRVDIAKSCTTGVTKESLTALLESGRVCLHMVALHARALQT